VVRHYNR